MSKVKTSRDGGCMEIILDQPESMNALDLDMFEDFIAALQEAEDPDVRAVVLRGEGKAFCVGGNVKAFADMVSDGSHIPVTAPERLHEMLKGLRSLPKPVIASVHGACAGAGVSLMLACDLAFAAEDTKFLMAYLSIGVSPDGGSTHFLPRHVGVKKAMELFLSKTPIDAAEALSLGLINQVVPADEVLALARREAARLAQGPTAAYGKLKDLFNTTGHSSLEEQLDKEARYFSDSSKTADFREGVSAFAEKRKPQFQGK